MGRFIVGAIVGAGIIWWGSYRPVPPLYAFACAAADLDGAVNMDGDLICTTPGSTIRADQIMESYLERLQDGLGRAVR